jgi:AcrR family transcriptional regulator
VARPARFDDDAIMDAALRVIAATGPSVVSIEAIAAEMEGNIGSIYYRFPSKDHLLARLWLRCSQQGEAGMIRALRTPARDDAIIAAALHYPQWSRTHLAEAQVLAAYGRERLAPNWPDDLAAELDAANRDLLQALSTFTRHWSESPTAEQRQIVTFAILDIPVAAIRRYLLAGKRPPRRLDTSIVAAVHAALRRDDIH